MAHLKSEAGSSTGTLYMLSTHIGHTEDLPLRSLSVLREADLLVFEEDRPARRALKAAKVQREYLKFSEHVQKETLASLRACLERGGTVAYMSDQGSPVLADPGFPVLALAWKLNAKIRVIPGPSSLTAALSACPFRVEDFYFAGFLSRREKERREQIVAIGRREEAVMLMDAPYRLRSLLASLAGSLAANRRCFLALDISGPDEQWLYGSLTEIGSRMARIEKKLNFVLILEGRPLQPASGHRLQKPGKKVLPNAR